MINLIGIHSIHRKMALVTWMSMNQKGKLNLDEVAIQMLKPLLKENLSLIQRLDELKNLSFIAYELNDMKWLQEICQQIEELEAKMI